MARGLVFAAALLAVSCGESRVEVPGAVRLVDLFRPESVDAQAPRPTVPKTEWRFDSPRGFEAGPGVAGLAVRDGRLVGRTTRADPVLRIEGSARPEPGEFVHAVEVRLRASAGRNLHLDLSGSERPDFGEVAARPRALWTATSPLVPGTELRTYTLRPLTPVPSSSLRHAFLALSDAADASFEIESIRIVLEKEFLAGIPSGVGWHGLSEIYRETIVARAPETIRIGLTIPERAWLDVGLGTVEDAPVTFRASALQPSGETLLLERTLTTPRRWEPVPIDLAPLAGRRVELALSLVSEKPGALGFWGAPVVRTRATTGDAPLQGVILIQADTLRRDHLDVYGYPRETAPVLRRMAEEGVLFRDCIVQGTWTKVSSPSLLLSLYPSSHGIANFPDRLPESAVTLAESFRSAGFATLSLSSIFFTGKLTNLQQGFEELHESASVGDLSSSKTAREYVDRLLPWLERHRDVPFFVYLHVFDPHDPYKPGRPWDARFGDATGKEEHEREAQQVRSFIANPLLRAFGMPAREDLAKAGFDPEAYAAHEVDWYDGSIRALDVEIGRLLEALRGLGLAERTLVVFTSDHGEEFLEHGRMFHGQSVYGELSQVPLLVWGPGRVPAGVAVEETVQTVDLAPTMLELAGLPPLPQAQGRSLAPLWAPRSAGQGPPPGWPRPAITEKPAESDPDSPTAIGGVSTAIVLDGWKLIHNQTRSDRRSEYELYDDRRDPLNRSDVAAQHPDVVTRLAAELDAWRASVAPLRLEPESGSAEPTSPEELERLRSLGYVQ